MSFGDFSLTVVVNKVYPIVLYMSLFMYVLISIVLLTILITKLKLMSKSKFSYCQTPQPNMVTTNTYNNTKIDC